MGPATPIHVISALVKQEVEAERMPSDVYYAQDVRDAYRYTFTQGGESGCTLSSLQTLNE